MNANMVQLLPVQFRWAEDRAWLPTGEHLQGSMLPLANCVKQRWVHSDTQHYGMNMLSAIGQYLRNDVPAVPSDRPSGHQLMLIMLPGAQMMPGISMHLVETVTRQCLIKAASQAGTCLFLWGFKAQRQCLGYGRDPSSSAEVYAFAFSRNSAFLLGKQIENLQEQSTFLNNMMQDVPPALQVGTLLAYIGHRLLSPRYLEIWQLAYSIIKTSDTRLAVEQHIHLDHHFPVFYTASDS